MILRIVIDGWVWMVGIVEWIYNHHVGSSTAFNLRTCTGLMHKPNDDVLG